MKKQRDFIIFLEDMADSVKKIEEYTKGISQKSFLGKEQIIDAVIRRFEIIGEASRHIPASFKRKYKDVEWKKIAGMRNVLIHEYFGVNKEKLWLTIKEDIPVLKVKLLEIFEEFKKQKLL